MDIKRAEGLRDLAADDIVFSIGAGFMHAEIEDGAIEDPTGGLLRTIAGGIAYRAIRNRGTLGGSLAHADPAAERVSAMSALNAAIVAHAAGGRRRRLAADGFMRGAFATSLADDEVLTSVEVPRFSPQARFGYYKLCPRPENSPRRSASPCWSRITASRAWWPGRWTVRPCCCPLPRHGCVMLDHRLPHWPLRTKLVYCCRILPPLNVH